MRVRFMSTYGYMGEQSGFRPQASKLTQALPTVDAIRNLENVEQCGGEPEQDGTGILCH